jgi:hypothetical protein
LYFGKEIILPIVVALVLRLLLAPAQRVLTERGHLPRSTAASSGSYPFRCDCRRGIHSFHLRNHSKSSGEPSRLKERLAILRQPIDFLQKGLKGSRNIDDCNRSGKRIGAGGYCLTELRTHPGPLFGAIVFFAVGILSFDLPWYAVMPAGAYVPIHVVEGETITPMLLASRLTLNPVLVIVSLFFGHTIWSIPGVLAVPFLAISKIVCDRIDRLKPMGHILGS